MVTSKQTTFQYKKSEAEEPKSYNLLILNEDDLSISGISFDYLTPKEQEEVLKIQLDYTEKMKPFVNKAYRKFLKDKMVH